MRPLLLILAAAACGPSAPLQTPPDALGGLPLHHRLDGDRAREAVARLHQDGSTGVDSAWIAHYGDDEPSAMLYVGITPDSATAVELIAKMGAGIRSRPSPFRYAGPVAIGDRVLHLLQGQGQLHYAFVIDRYAVWLSVSPTVAPAALADVLGRDPGDPALDAVTDGPGTATDSPRTLAGLGPLVRDLVVAGALDTLRLATVLRDVGSPLTPRQRRVLAGEDLPLRVDADNAAFLLNTLWTLGLVNRNPVLTRGPMVTRSRWRVGRFASTGGWRLGSRPATDVYATADLIPLQAGEQERLERVAQAVFRPCCDNSTHFPDCNHGMAMLGLLTLLTTQGADEAALFQAARAANGIWFPAQSRHIAAYLQTRGRPEARTSVGRELASISGHKRLMSRLTDDRAGTPLPC